MNADQGVRMTLAEFLLARIDKDEDLAKYLDGDWHWHRGSLKSHMLAECEAKRRIIALCTGDVYDRDVSPQAAEYILESLALPYARHPDYREEWRPSER